MDKGQTGGEETSKVHVNRNINIIWLKKKQQQKETKEYSYLLWVQLLRHSPQGTTYKACYSRYKLQGVAV